MCRPAVNPVPTPQPLYAITSAPDAAGMARENKRGRLLERPPPRARAIRALGARHHLPEQCTAQKGPVNSLERRPASRAGIQHQLGNSPTYMFIRECLYGPSRRGDRAGTSGRSAHDVRFAIGDERLEIAVAEPSRQRCGPLAAVLAGYFTSTVKRWNVFSLPSPAVAISVYCPGALKRTVVLALPLVTGTISCSSFTCPVPL